MGLHFSVDLSVYDLFLIVFAVLCGLFLYILQAVPVAGTATQDLQLLQVGDSSPVASSEPEFQNPLTPPVIRRVYGEDRSVKSRASALQSDLA